MTAANMVAVAVVVVGKLGGALRPPQSIPANQNFPSLQKFLRLPRPATSSGSRARTRVSQSLFLRTECQYSPTRLEGKLAGVAPALQGFFAARKLSASPKKEFPARQIFSH